ncbi:MAG: LysM peptidoglycan-binding domain-containing protein [Treponema sp.]|jgi:nucleoid-associated protein YgaU|nr:LysM peptidoglycan-binding domain-containing protein [Treponema sp.]
MGSTIGIKIANGDFYPILEENTVVKKRLIVTTVYNNQASIHIDLYKSATQTLADACPIGRMVVEPIKPAQKGEPSIKLVVSSNQKGELIVDAVDLDPSSPHEHQLLQVYLNAEAGYIQKPQLSEVNLELVGVPPQGLYETKSEKRRVPWLLLVGILLFLGGILWFFVFKGKISINFDDFSLVTAYNQAAADISDEAEPVVPASIPPQEESAAVPLASSTEVTGLIREAPVAQTEVPVLVIEAPVTAPPQDLTPNRNRPAPPVASYKVPATIPRSGVSYRIRWGDTLWDISEAFYRNPWLYPRIARFNNIRRPDLIVAGRVIRIPPRN